MNAHIETLENPFPAEAVATYGSSGITCDSLSYVLAVQRELQDYLQAYPVEGTRYGGGIGLQGGHGSGKTHVLGWLGGNLRTTRSIRGNVVYGKCNSTRFSDLCSQLLKQLERPMLIELIQLALLRLARTRVRVAKVTESLVDRLQTVGGLQQLQDEQNIDLSQLREQLQQALQDSTARADSAHLVLDLSDPILGPDAYNWLTGSPLENPAGLGLSAPAPESQVPPGAEADPEAEARAIDALELIAALHRLAGVPLLVLIDQLEVLLRTASPAAFQTSNSLIKKFVEHVGRQSALIFIAGIPEAWEKLTRDMSARLRRRENIVVGNLTLDETRVFLNAFISNPAQAQTLPDAAVTLVRELSGGTPREILRIAFRAYGKVAGDLAQLDPAVLLESARSSGTLSDRGKLALSIMSKACSEYGRVVQDFRAGDQAVDLVLLDENGEVVFAVVIAKATDSLDEVNSARRIKIVQSICDKQWPHAELVVVSVGYSSTQVQAILRMNDPPLVFDERTFESELRTRLVIAIQRSHRLRTQQHSEDDQSIQILQAIRKFADQQEAGSTQSHDMLTALKQATDRFNQLHDERLGNVAQIKDRFEQGAREVSAPQIAAAALVTRRGMLDMLDSVREAITFGNDELQRNLIRSILVANESVAKDPLVEAVGEFFLDRLALDRLYPPGPETMAERLRIVSVLTTAIRRTRTPWWLRSLPVYAANVVTSAIFFGISTWVSFASTRGAPSVCFGSFALPCARNLTTVIPYLILWAELILTAVYGLAWWTEYHDKMRITRQVMNAPSQRASIESSLSSRYPQSQ